jgi:hypothetical protein
MSNRLTQARERRIELIKQRLIRRSMPRLQVSLILVLTGTAGFLTSFLLLHSGLQRMWVRYPIAILVSYCVFLLLLRLWLWLQGRRFRGDLDAPDSQLLDIIPTGGPVTTEELHFGGGSAGGGGAGGNWGEGVVQNPAPSYTLSSDGSTSDGFSLFDLDVEDGWLIILAVIALIGGLVASLYIIYIAPALLAEILVDGVLVAGLYRRLKGVENRHWLRAAARQTIIPALLVAIFFGVAGYAMQAAVPEAHSIGDVWKHITKS